MHVETEGVLQRAYDSMKEGNHKKKEPKAFIPLHTDRSAAGTTAVPISSLQEINRELLSVPDGFQVYPKLERICSVARTH